MDFMYPLIGGLTIGFSSTLMLAGLGRITVISGILSVLFTKPNSTDAWKYFFILGLIGGGFIWYNLFPQFFEYTLEASPARAVIAGLLVGFGTRLGSGCTSGHGVCGLPRMAMRSLVATLSFMLFGIITVAIEGLLK